MNSPPTIPEELERKTVEELERLVHGHHTGRMSDEVFMACILTLWNATAGLVSRQTLDLLTMSQRAITGKSRRYAVLGNDSRLVVVAKVNDEAAFTIVMSEAGTVRTIKYVEPYGDHAAAQQRFDSTVSAFKKSLSHVFQD